MASLTPPLSVPQLAPAGHKRPHFFFAVARGVTSAAVEVGNEVAFLVDAYMNCCQLKGSLYNINRTILARECD